MINAWPFILPPELLEKDCSMHYGFSDECSFNTGRFRSIAIVTLNSIDHDEVTRSLQMEDLQSVFSREVKWQDTRQGKHVRPVSTLMDRVVSLCKRRLLRVDILAWDIEDSRHAIVGRNDNENLGYMYYHACSNVLKRRWSGTEKWVLYPDEQSQFDWRILEDVLTTANSVRSTICDFIEGMDLRTIVSEKYGIVDIVQRKSQDTPLIQVADMFAGMTVWSRNSFNEYVQVTRKLSEQLSLPIDSASEISNHSNSISVRAHIVWNFLRSCKSARIPLSLESSGFLKTHDPSLPINFWWYIPQHPNDRAPLHDTKRS